jgi:hypothetical protein
VKEIVMALAAGMLLVGPALAQNINVGGEQQQRNTKVTTIKSMMIGPDGRPYEKTESINENLPTNPTGKLEYSGVPCKFMRTTGAIQQKGPGGQ